MSEDLNENFVNAIKSGDIGTAEKLISVSGLSNPNTWYSLFTLLRDLGQADDDISPAISRLLLSQAHKEVLTKIFRSAVIRSCEDVVDAIMREKPTFDINAYDENGDTFIHLAFQHPFHSKVVKRLCYKVADVDAKNKEGSTALHLAARTDNQFSAYHLMDAGANFDMKDTLGRTALHIAEINDSTSVIEQLLSFGADVNITCNNNMTPLGYLGPNAGILKRYIAARMAFNFYVSNKNSVHIYLDRSMFREAVAEVAGLKTEIIDISNISYYDFFTCGMNQLAVYAKNEKLICAVNLRKWNYPWYYGFIYNRVELGEKRKDLLSSSLKSLDIAICALFNKALPDTDVAYAITDYLSNKDLENLIKAAPSAED